jgi:hypothetical protein
MADGAAGDRETMFEQARYIRVRTMAIVPSVVPRGQKLTSSMRLLGNLVRHAHVRVALVIRPHRSPFSVCFVDFFCLFVLYISNQVLS